MTSSNTPSSPSMLSGPWRTLNTSRLASRKAYVSIRATYDALSYRLRGSNPENQSWDGSARQTSGKGQQILPWVAKVQLFPGWAVRCYLDPANANQEVSPGTKFDLKVYVSGFASSVRPAEAATRYQKAFYRIAKGYAAIPKLSSDAFPKSETPPCADASVIPPTPPDMGEGSELVDFQSYPEEIPNFWSHSYGDKLAADEDTTQNSSSSDGALSDMDESARCGTSILLDQSGSFVSEPEESPDSLAQKLHANLDARLQHFLSNKIPNRMIKISIFCPLPDHSSPGVQEDNGDQETYLETVATQDVITDNQGSFQTTLVLPWERLATFPSTTHIAFGESNNEYPVVIQAEMVDPPSPPLPVGTPPHLSQQSSYISHSQLHPSRSNSSSPLPSPARANYENYQLTSIRSRVTVSLSNSHVPIRLISDIDDTIKHVGVPLGAKNVFQNVFVRHLEDLVVHSMVSWYRMMWERGIRFHYVSNSPYELLPVLNDFFRISSLPQGSIKLKSYAVRSLLPALLSSAASRKRQGVIEVLDAFPESRFILVGDSGEQDMELYAEVARARPEQIVGVFIRNVSTGVSESGLKAEQPQEIGAQNAQFATVPTDGDPVRSFPPSPKMRPSRALNTPRDEPRSRPQTPSPKTPPPYVLPSTSPAASPTFPGLPRRKSFPGLPRRTSFPGMSTEEKRRVELAKRVDRVRQETPEHIPFRVFHEPDECVEVEAILSTWLGR